MSRYLKTAFPITLVVVLIVALFTFRGEAQQNSKSPAASSSALKPISGVAVAFAETDAVRDLPDADVVRSEATDEREGENKNPDNIALADFYRARIAAQPQRKQIPSFDAAIAGAPASPNAVGAPLISFDGMTANDGITTIGGIVAPSDEQIAVGPKDVVQVTNTGFRIYDKAGNPKVAPKPIRALFSKLGGVCAQFERGDPIVQYDRQASRWVISQFNFASANGPTFFECIAVSKTSDPTGVYYAYAFQTPNESPVTGINFPDYPKLTTWIDGYYMTVNQFDRSQPPGSQFNGTGMYAFNRAKMLVGDPTANFIYFNLNLASHPEGVASVQPADIDGFTLPAAGQPCPFAYHLSDEYEIPPFNVDAMRMFNFHADFATPASSTFTERAESPIALLAYDARFPQFETGTAAEAEQPPPSVASDSLNVIGYRVMYRLQYRRLGNNENLTGVFMVNASGVDPNTAALYQGALRYFQLRKTTAAGAYSVFDQATFAPDPADGATGTNRFMGSAAIDHQGNLAVSYSTSSTSIFPSITYAGRDFNAAGIPNAGLTGEQTLFAGTGVQRGTSNRWGDYQSLQVDPTDDCTFWTTNQYYNTTTLTFNWRTRIGSFRFPSCVAPDQGTVSGTITSCETGAPISGALIQFNNGFSTTSGPDGKYSIQLASGPVQTIANYTMTVSNPSRLCNSAGPFTVGVAKDGTTLRDVCLSGTANPILETVGGVAADPNAVVISGGDGDGQFDPNECNTMNLRLTNPGCATAKNLTATLTSSTPGVTIVPPGTAPYPDIVIDGNGFNSVPFKVNTDPTVFCGTINFTLTTTFNGGSTVSNFSVPTACGTAANQSFSGSIDAADPDTTNGRVGRADPASSCAAPKTCSVVGTGGRSHDTYTLVNGPGPSCITFTPTTGGGSATIEAAAYLGVFDPTNVCSANFLATQALNLSQFSFNVPANATFTIVILENSAGTASTPYAFDISGISAPPAQGPGPCPSALSTLSTQVSSANVTLGQSISDTATLTTGGSPTGAITFRLYGPNNATCAGTAIFTSVQSVNGNGTYGSGSFTPTAAGVYSWIATYSGDANNGGAAGACNDPNESTTVAAAPTPTPTPASQTVNLSTRMRVAAGDENAGIGGFIITGSAPKHVIIRALGPSLTRFGFSSSEVLADPTLEVHGPGSFGTIFNNNWRDQQQAQIAASGLAPTNDLESAIDVALPPGAYTGIVRGNTGTPLAGIAVFEVYDLDTGAASKLANLSTRAFVGTGSNVVIAGFILGNNSGDDRIVVRGLGPSLEARGVSNTLQNPTLELRDNNGTLLMANQDWQDDSAQAAELIAAGLAPSEDVESAIAATLPPGLYTAILAGLNDTQGVGIVEVYDRGP